MTIPIPPVPLDFTGAVTRPVPPAARPPFRLADLAIAGGAVYDALVGAAARHYRLPLAARDRRAVDVYRALDVDVEVLT